jgi:peptidyl-prolyl cis-trans isomerase C
MNQWRESIAHWLREPLVHFLIAGTAIFAFYAWRGDAVDVGDRQIIVREAEVERLANIWSQTWRRPPDARELDGLIRDYIKEEVYYREAVRLGLDQNDAIVRRRLRAKMEFLSSAEAETMVASDTVLQAWLDKYPARYAEAPLVSFQSVYVSTIGGDTVASRKAKALLGQLQAGTDPKKLGDPISLPRSQSKATSEEIDRQFGEAFAGKLVALPRGEWAGPIASGFGLHLVRVDEASAARLPKLAEVRQRVENDWRSATRIARENQAYQTLLDGYDIKIERP